MIPWRYRLCWPGYLCFLLLLFFAAISASLTTLASVPLITLLLYISKRLRHESVRNARAVSRKIKIAALSSRFLNSNLNLAKLNIPSKNVAAPLLPPLWPIPESQFGNFFFLAKFIGCIKRYYQILNVHKIAVVVTIIFYFSFVCGPLPFVGLCLACRLLHKSTHAHRFKTKSKRFRTTWRRGRQFKIFRKRAVPKMNAFVLRPPIPNVALEFAPGKCHEPIFVRFVKDNAIIRPPLVPTAPARAIRLSTPPPETHCRQPVCIPHRASGKEPAAPSFPAPEPRPLEPVPVTPKRSDLICRLIKSAPPGASRRLLKISSQFLIEHMHLLLPPDASCPFFQDSARQMRPKQALERHLSRTRKEMASSDPNVRAMWEKAGVMFSVKYPSPEDKTKIRLANFVYGTIHEYDNNATLLKTVQGSYIRQFPISTRLILCSESCLTKFLYISLLTEGWTTRYESKEHMFGALLSHVVKTGRTSLPNFVAMSLASDSEIEENLAILSGRGHAPHSRPDRASASSENGSDEAEAFQERLQQMVQVMAPHQAQPKRSFSDFQSSSASPSVVFEDYQHDCDFPDGWEEEEDGDKDADEYAQVKKSRSGNPEDPQQKEEVAYNPDAILEDSVSEQSEDCDEDDEDDHDAYSTEEERDVEEVSSDEDPQEAEQVGFEDQDARLNPAIGEPQLQHSGAVGAQRNRQQVTDIEEHHSASAAAKHQPKSRKSSLDVAADRAKPFPEFNVGGIANR